MWSEVLGPLSRAGFRVVALDLPGFGEAPAEIAGRAPDPWLRVLEAMDELAITRAALIGNSYGGSVALRVASVAPERLWALMCVSALVPGLEPSPALTAAWEAEEAALEKGDLELAVQAVVDAWTLPDASPALRARVARWQRRAFELQRGVEPDPEEDDDASDPLAAGVDSLAGLDTPLLAAVGALDMLDFQDGCEVLARVNDDARAVPIPGAGHLAPLEAPQEFLRLAVTFLRSSLEQGVP